MRRKIPSLHALLAFDAAARHQNFTRAADELALSESAISRQISGLEANLEIKLFSRTKGRVTLTQAGLVYSEQVKQSLDRIERDTLEVMAHEGKGGVIELAVLPTFASQWLIPRLGNFLRQHPGVTINMSACTGEFLFKDTRFNAAIYFGESNWPGVETHYLFSEQGVPVCAPDLISRKRRMTARILSTYPLLHSARRPDDWYNWFLATGVSDANAMRGPRFELHSMLISAACAGMGLALVPRFLVSEQLRSGALVIPFDYSLVAPKAGYYFAAPVAGQLAKPLVLFREWLQAEAALFHATARK